MTMELTVREICGWSLTILGAVGSAAWAFMKWLHRGISRKLDKIDTLDATINSLFVRGIPIGNLYVKAENPSAEKFDIDVKLSGAENNLTAKEKEKLKESPICYHKLGVIMFYQQTEVFK